QIRKYYRVRVSRSQWPIEQIPPHLKIRYILQDGSGRTLIKSRNFSDLKVEKSGEQESSTLNQLRNKWERTNITTWDFEELPEKIPLQSKKNKLLGFAYPCLQRDDQGHISIRLLTDPDESKRISREGVLGLYSLQFPKHFKLLKKDCTLPSSLWALYEGLGSRQQLNEDTYHFILDEIFGSKNSLCPPKDVFLKLVETVKKEGLFNRARQLTELVLDLLKERRESIDQMNKLQRMSHAKSRSTLKMNLFKEELTEIVPADFLQQFDKEQMVSAIRYCKALQIRMERAYVSPEKDAVKAEQFLPFINRFKELKPQDSSPECLKLLKEYHNMLAEYKISVFAQEMKTRFPVSAKRLEKKWEEIMNSC
ncbi:DUF3418 domain-containing protein, partial [Thermodesulfobacteriota bacterium]